MKIDIIKQEIYNCEGCRHSFDRKKCILANRLFYIPDVINRIIPGWCPLTDNESLNYSDKLITDENKIRLLDDIVNCIENLGFGESRALPFCIESFPELAKLLSEYKKLINI